MPETFRRVSRRRSILFEWLQTGELSSPRRSVSRQYRKNCRINNLSTAAARQRLHREREASGRIVLQVEVDETNLSVGLVEAGLISPNDADDKAKLQAGLSRLIEIVLTADMSRVTAHD